MEIKCLRSVEVVVCAFDVAAIVAIASITRVGAVANLRAPQPEFVWAAISALVSTFLLRLAQFDAGGCKLPAIQYALRTLALWFVVQGFVFVKMIALTTFTLAMLYWFVEWSIGVAVVLVVFRIVVGMLRRDHSDGPTPSAHVVIPDSGKLLSPAMLPLSRGASFAKSVFDLAFASAALIVLMPLLFVIAAAVKLSSPGPVLFMQKRRGLGASTFRIYKFRTMRMHARKLDKLAQATRDDPRVTKVGAFLRRTSLDELPQFINVLFGEMSVVGPRPHALEHDDEYRDLVTGYSHRYLMKPGITGWAQVNGFRGETDRIEKMQARIDHDLHYLRNWSFGLDLRIIGATVMNGFVHRNAY